MDSYKSLQHNDLLQELIKNYVKQNNLCYKSIIEMVEDFEIYTGTLPKFLEDDVQVLVSANLHKHTLHAKMIPSGMETDFDYVNSVRRCKPISEQHYDEIILHEECQQLIQKSDIKVISIEEPMINYSVLSLATLQDENLIQ